jgi:hypothetical protein
MTLKVMEVAKMLIKCSKLGKEKDQGKGIS